MSHAMVVRGGVGVARCLGGLARFRGRAAVALCPGDGGGLVGATQGCERRNKEGQNDLVTFFHDEVPVTGTEVSGGYATRRCRIALEHGYDDDQTEAQQERADHNPDRHVLVFQLFFDIQTAGDKFEQLEAQQHQGESEQSEGSGSQ